MVGLPYDGEPVDQLEHALQCARACARASAATTPSSSSPACCTTSRGRRRSPGIAYDGPREHHGEAGARWLTPRVGARVAWLAEQHVPAKRYLVATDPAYRDRS